MRTSHFQAGNSFQIDARTHGTTDQAHGARVTGAGGERRVLRDRPATHGWHAGPGETTRIREKDVDRTWTVVRLWRRLERRRVYEFRS